MVVDETPGVFSPVTFTPLAKNLIRINGVLRYEWEVNGTFPRFTLPDGQVFDGASIPAWATELSALLPFFETIYPFGIHAFAAAFHDKIWEYQGRLPEGMYQCWNPATQQWEDAAYGADGKPVWTFTTSNKLFARHLRELGVGKTERRAMFLAVQSPVGYINWCKGKVPADARPKRLAA